MIHEDFLLRNEWAKTLYHRYAKDMPIIDYHCHLDPKTIYENQPFENLTQIWLNDQGLGDHYKWRLMRANGVSEQLISGDGDDYEKFIAFVRTVEKAIGNPIYEWSHLELRRFFNIELVIKEENADAIWTQANQLLQQSDFRPQQLIEKMNVKLVATTDDPTDNLQYHLKLKQAALPFKVLPTFRPDKVMNIQAVDFTAYLTKLAQVSNQSITSFDELKTILKSRVDFFHQQGGRLADHGLNTFHFIETTTTDAAIIFHKALQQKTITQEEAVKYQSYLQLYLMQLYTEKEWTMQLHMNVFRNDSPLHYEQLGPDAGFDSIGDQADLASQLLQLYACAQQQDAIPRSIWYSLNPNDWIALATLMGSFQGDCRQQIHLGCAWWFNDTYDGMRTQLTTYAQQSLLGNFVGMLTDSRSFLSYPRHEYFRRVLCQLIGEWVEEGRVAADEEFLGRLIVDICYENAAAYFHFFD